MISGSDIAELLFEGVLRTARELLMYWTGRIVVPVVTFGKFRVERFDVNEKSRRSRTRPSQPRTLRGETGILIGLSCWIAAGVIAWFALRP